MSGDIVPIEQVVQTDSLKKVENFIRKSNTLKELFSDGIKSHTEYLKTQNPKTDSPNLSPLESVLANYKKLDEVIKSGFAGYVIRKKEGILSDGWLNLSFCNPTDLNPRDKNYLNISDVPKVEFNVNIKKFEGFDHQSGKSPEVISDSKGYQIGIYARSIGMEGGYAAKKEFDGLSVSTNCNYREAGWREKVSTAMAIKQIDIRVLGNRENKYKLDQDKVCNLAQEIDHLQVFK